MTSKKGDESGAQLGSTLVISIVQQYVHMHKLGVFGYMQLLDNM
jgi:hypothetical protein